METQRSKRPHDKFFKAFMKLMDVAEDLLRGTLPLALQDLLQMGELTPNKTDFLSPEWKEAFADVTYRIRIPESIQVDVLVLFEHKSFLPNPREGSDDKPVVLQLLEYITGVWEGNYKQKTGYQYLLPIIFYHGRKAWPYEDLLEELFGKPLEPQDSADILEDKASRIKRELRRYQPSFDYILVNLHDYDDDRILATFKEGKLRASLMAMRDYALGEPVLRIPRYISNLHGVAITDLSLSYLRDLTNYILALGPENAELEIMKEIKEEAVKLHPSDEPGFVSALDAINRRNREVAEKAVHQEKLEMARKLKRKKMSAEDIAEITELPVEVIKAL